MFGWNSSQILQNVDLNASQCNDSLDPGMRSKSFTCWARARSVKDLHGLILQVVPRYSTWAAQNTAHLSQTSECARKFPNQVNFPAVKVFPSSNEKSQLSTEVLKLGSGCRKTVKQISWSLQPLSNSWFQSAQFSGDFSCLLPLGYICFSSALSVATGFFGLPVSPLQLPLSDGFVFPV